MASDPSQQDDRVLAPVQPQHSQYPSRYRVDSSLQEPEDDVDSEEDSVLGQILKNYNFHCTPEMRLKFKQQLKSYSIGLAVAKPWHYKYRVRLTAKPLSEDQGLGKLVQKYLLIPTHSQACVFSRKLHLGLFRLQFIAGYNWTQNRCTLDYRLTTKWSDGARIKRKERYQLADHVLLRAKWNMDLLLPDVEGHLGNEPDELGGEAMDVDLGRLDFEISQVDLVIDSPLRLLGLGGSRKQQHTGSSSDSGESDAGSSSGSSKKAAASSSTSSAGQGSASSGTSSRAGGGLGASRGERAQKEKGQAQGKGGVAASPSTSSTDSSKAAETGASLQGSGGQGPQQGGNTPDWLHSFLSKFQQPQRK